MQLMEMLNRKTQKCNSIKHPGPFLKHPEQNDSLSKAISEGVEKNAKKRRQMVLVDWFRRVVTVIQTTGQEIGANSVMNSSIIHRSDVVAELFIHQSDGHYRAVGEQRVLEQQLLSGHGVVLCDG